MGSHIDAPWPFAKIERAKQHTVELRSRIDGWVAATDLRPVPNIADDRLSWSVRLNEFEPAPLSQWALILGDSVHNLRSALDVLVWAHVKSDQLTESQERQIAFPVWTERSSWDERHARVLKTVPTGAVARILNVQPFQRVEAERSGDPLNVLSQLDNTDKHRLALTATVETQAAEVTHSIQFEEEGAAARNTPPSVTMHDALLAPSAILMSGTTQDAIASIGGSYTLTVQVGLNAGAGFIGAVDLLEKLTAYTSQVVHYVLHGVAETP